MEKLTLKDLELSIPSVSLLDARNILGGSGYGEDPALDGGEIEEVVVEGRPGEGPERPDEPDPFDDDRDDDDRNETPDRDEENDRNEDDKPDPKPGEPGYKKSVEDFKPSGQPQLPGGCAFEALLEKYNHQNPEDKKELGDIYKDYIDYWNDNHPGEPLPNDLDGMDLSDLGGLYEQMFGDPQDFMDAIDDGHVEIGIIYDEDGGGHAVIMEGYGWDDDGDFYYDYYDPEDAQHKQYYP